MKNDLTRARKREFSSAQTGTREMHEIKMPGRVMFDLYPLIRAAYKLRSYSLNSVSSHFLKQQKDDVHYSIMGKLQSGSPDDRRRLAKYCLKDSELVVRLMQKLLFVINNVEMARVTGVPMSFLVTRGQGIKVQSQLYRKARTQDIIIPYRKGEVDGSFQGATVLEPVTGFYETPITTLDFASLYPSIMMAHNLCYSTLTNPKHAKSLGLKDDDITRTPEGSYFVKSRVRKGLLPEILNDLLSQRKIAKRDMKAAKDPFLKAVFNGRQLALKISANSVYGFTGATNGALPCMSISSSVTGFGRNMIEDTKNYVEKHYTVANGFAKDAEVIYGDTDSVMIKFGVEDMAESMRLGEEAAALVSEIFISPIKLEFEKVYKPYLLINKKRYAGMLWTQPDKYSYMDCKGIETVRRDNCTFVTKTLQKSLDFLLIDVSVEKAKKYIQESIGRLMQNKVDLSDLVLTKQLQKLESYTNKQPHTELVKKMMVRDPGNVPSVGDRVPFVYVKKQKGAKNYEKAEDPLYVLEHDLPLDIDHYIKTQLEKPLKRLFEPIMKDKVNTLFWGQERFKVKNTFRGAKRGTGSFMSKFVIIKKKCMKCQTTLNSKGNETLCKKCLPFKGQVYAQKAQSLRFKQTEYTRLWTECQRCQGSMFQEVLCSNHDCPIFYRRVKCKKDLDQMTEDFNKFYV